MVEETATMDSNGVIQVMLYYMFLTYIYFFVFFCIFEGTVLTLGLLPCRNRHEKIIGASLL